MGVFVNNVDFMQIYPAPPAVSAGAFLVADTTTSAFWAYPGSGRETPSGVLETRSTFTHGYTAGGYKDSNPWRNINKTWHANDVTMNCGEQLYGGFDYGGGTFSDYNGYVHGCNGSVPSGGTQTSSYSLATGIMRTRGAGVAGAAPGGPFGYTGNNPVGDGQGIAYGTAGAIAGVGSWDLSQSYTYHGASVNQLGQTGYITGGNSGALSCDKFYFPTEIMYTTTSPSINGAHVTSAFGSTKAYWSLAGNLRVQTFSNDSWATWSPGTTVAPDGVCKALSTKKGWHYIGGGSNVTTPFVKFSDSTGTYTSNTLTKPQALGEENMQMGQEWGYCLGQYNGYQNNYTFKVMYSNDAMTVLGTASQPKGHAGLSSATCSSAASSVTMSYR